MHDSETPESSGAHLAGAGPQSPYHYQLPPGLKIWATPPTAYEMHYFNGTFSYNEPFVAMRAPPSAIGGYLAAYDAAFAAIAAACAAVPVIGPGLAFCVEVGAQWFKGANLDPDGGITFFAARHYIGTNACGVDLTASPIPGIPPQAWVPAVDGMISAARALPLQSPPSPTNPHHPSPHFTPVRAASAPENVPYSEGIPLLLRGETQGNRLG